MKAKVASPVMLTSLAKATDTYFQLWLKSKDCKVARRRYLLAEKALITEIKSCKKPLESF